MNRQRSIRLDPDSWVDDYGQALHAFALARVGNTEVAEDLVPETYFSALRSRQSFRGISSEKTWLFGILKHKILDHFRKRRQSRAADTAALNPEGPELSSNAHSPWRASCAVPCADPEHAYRYREFLDHLNRCLSKLPQRAAGVFVSREIEGLSTGEICRIFGVSKPNCWTILYRAKTLLRNHLEGCGFKPSA